MVSELLVKSKIINKTFETKKNVMVTNMIWTNNIYEFKNKNFSLKLKWNS